VLLGDVVGPLAVGVLFYAIVAPLGFVMRLTGKDPLPGEHHGEVGGDEAAAFLARRAENGKRLGPLW
jgi:hypothetical protein